MQAAAHTIGQQLLVLDVSSDRDIETAFVTIVQRGAGALLVGTGAFMNTNRERSPRWRLAMGCRRAIGARKRCGRRPDELWGAAADAYRQAGVYAGRILKGEKPAELPVMRPTKFEFVIHINTAKELGSKYRRSCSRLPTR